MTKTPELDSFIKASVKAGKSLEDVKAVLFKAGWDENRVSAALEYYYPADYPIAVPRPKTFVSPRLFFLNLFYFLLNYLIIYSVISILFTMLDHYFPDGLRQYGSGIYYASSISNAVQDNLAIILVSVPVLYITHSTIVRAIRSTKQSIPRIRLILIYFTLFVGACIMLSNACFFVYYFLKGELSIRFVIKVTILTTTVIGLYLYYRDELKRDEQNA